MEYFYAIALESGDCLGYRYTDGDLEGAPGAPEELQAILDDLGSQPPVVAGEAAVALAGLAAASCEKWDDSFSMYPVFHTCSL